MKKIKIKSFDEDEIIFTDGSCISHDHISDCCEYNYADFSSIKDSILEDLEFDEITIEESEDDQGFLLNGHLINCYSSQNGYYSSDVDITLRGPDKKIIKELNVDCEMVD